MENKNIIMLRHAPMNLKWTNAWYTNQVEHLENYVVIDVTSRCMRNKEFMAEHPTFARDISPFFIGPVKTLDGATAYVFEHFWQCSKVYPCHVVNGEITKEFFEWRQKWFDLKEVSKKRSETRYPASELGFMPSDCLFTAWFDGEKYQRLNYIEARKKLYITEYAKLVANSESFKWMKSLVDSGKKIALVDFDAYQYYSKEAMEKRYTSYLNKCKEKGFKPGYTLDDFMKIKTIKDVINFKGLQAGHGVVIKMLLEGDIEVVDGKVIDHIGVLD